MSDYIIQTDVPTVSMGTHAILNRLQALSPVTKDKKYWHAFVVNMATLVRNVYTTSATPEQIVAAATTDAKMLLEYISSYATDVPAGFTYQPHVVLYFPHYIHLPEMYRKEKFPPAYQRYEECTPALVNSVLECAAAYCNSATISLKVCESSPTQPWPNLDLLTDFPISLDSRLVSDVVMISHIPVDYHLAPNFGSLTFIESFTGKVKPAEVIVTKVISDNSIPFNAYTHILFGDSVVLRAQLTRKQKTELRTIASTEHWELLSATAILDAILEHKFVDKSTILDPQL